VASVNYFNTNNGAIIQQEIPNLIEKV
jgi:hypothetical protein